MLRARRLWSVAGNDGTMAAIEKEKREQAKRKRGGTTKKSETAKKPKSEPVKKPRKAPVSGLELLRRAADKALKRSVNKIAKLLEQGAIDGKISSARFMVVLAEKKTPEVEPVEKDTRLIDWVERLTGEPRYKDEREEGLCEVGEGGVEPEF